MVGLEFNPAVGEATPTLNHTLVDEDPARPFAPMVTVGTSSDRIFSPRGAQSVYATVGQTLRGTPFAPYVGVSWSGWERRLLYPFGLNVALSPEWDAMVQHDGRNTHWLLTRKAGMGNVSLLLVKGRYAGVSFGVRF